MSATEISPEGAETKFVTVRTEHDEKKARMAYSSRASTDFYGVLGWLAGLLITLFISLPLIIYLVNNASRSTRDEVLAAGLAVAWWLNPLSLGALGYLWGNRHIWRAWTALGLFIWFGVNVLVTLAFVSEDARIRIINGLLLLGYILLGLLFLYIQLRVFVWAASGKPRPLLFRDHGLGRAERADLLGVCQPGGDEHPPYGTQSCLPGHLHLVHGDHPVCGHLLVHGTHAGGGYPPG